MESVTAFGTILLAVATFLLAFFTWRVVKQTSELDKKNRKERLLKEVIDWGESVRKCSFVPDAEELIAIVKLTGEDKRRVWALKNEYQCQMVGARYTYLKSIASELDTSLQGAIHDVSNALAKHVLLLRLEYDGKTQDDDVPRSIDSIKEMVIKMIEVAVSCLPK